MEKKGNKRMNRELWQVKVKITQVPANQELETIKNPQTKELVQIEKSWFYDPFLNQDIYGVKLSINEGFSWEFFVKASSEKQAIKKGYELLSSLEHKFLGLTGEVSVIQISSDVLHQKKQFLELKMPPKCYLGGKKLQITNKFLYLFRKMRFCSIDLYILYQKEDSSYFAKLSKVSVLENYKTKIYVNISIKNNFLWSNTNLKQEVEGRLDFLAQNIKDIQGVRAKFVSVPLDTWEKILTSNVFGENNNKRPSILSPDQVDFTFPKETPLPKAQVFPFEKVTYLPVKKEDEDHIWIGKHIHNGIVDVNNSMVPLNNFVQSVIIGGQPQTGKTRFLGHISREFYTKAPKIGVLYLNLGKGEQNNIYKSDKVLKYGDSDLRIPYYVNGGYEKKSLQECASYLIACLGLGDPIDRLMYNVAKSFIQTNGDMPGSIANLFRGLKKWYLKHKYHEEYQTNILNAIDNRALSLFPDPTLEITLKYESSKIPQWYQDLREGKKIFVDLSMCNIYIKMLLSNAIFQIIRTLTPDFDVGELQLLIVIDEAHQILEKAKNNGLNDYDYTSKAKLEGLFAILLREFSGKGLSFVIADQSPSDLFDCVTKLPSLKILFRLGDQCIKKFLSNLEAQEFLKTIKNRQALVLDGVSGHKYVIETIDYDL